MNETSWKLGALLLLPDRSSDRHQETQRLFYFISCLGRAPRQKEAADGSRLGFGTGVAQDCRRRSRRLAA